MGDRANIAITDSNDPNAGTVYLYTHWKGAQIESLAAQGIAAAIEGGRADDLQYGTRIIADLFLRAHASSPHTGAGISASIGDGDDHVVHVDLGKGKVGIDGARAVSLATFVKKHA